MLLADWLCDVKEGECACCCCCCCCLDELNDATETLSFDPCSSDEENDDDDADDDEVREGPNDSGERDNADAQMLFLPRGRMDVVRARKG